MSSVQDDSGRRSSARSDIHDPPIEADQDTPMESSREIDWDLVRAAQFPVARNWAYFN
jgi:hypothetical protein